MKGEIQLTKKDLQAIAVTCYDLVKDAESKEEAVDKIAKYVSTQLGDYFGPAILIEPDEISIHFIELLDQIVFEINENRSGDDRIREYVIDDLFSRITIYLDIYKDKEIYKRNLCARIITKDDAIVIKNFNMSEYIPELLVEFFEQPELQKAIMWVLLNFKSNELLNFYYQIAKENYCLDVKILSLNGLKMFGPRFGNWDTLKETFADYSALVEYVENFDIEEIENNTIPEDLYSLLFLLNYIELNIIDLLQLSKVNWIISALNAILNFEIDKSLLPAIYKNITNLLLYFDYKAMRIFLQNEENIISFITIIDFLPREYFDRIVMKIALLGDIFIDTVHRLIAASKITPDDKTSNTLSFIFLGTQHTL